MPAILPFISVTARVASSAEEKATNAEPRLLGKGDRSGRGRQQSGTLKGKKRPRRDVRANSAIISANVASECARAGAGDAVKRPPAPDARIARVLFYLNSYRTWRRRRRA